MGMQRNNLRGGIRQKIFSMFLITIILIIVAYTAIFLYQSVLVEQVVNDAYEEQRQMYIANGFEEPDGMSQSNAVASFQKEMFHARNILIFDLFDIQHGSGRLLGKSLCQNLNLIAGSVYILHLKLSVSDA